MAGWYAVLGRYRSPGRGGVHCVLRRRDGWSFVDSDEEFGHYNIAQVDGHAAAAIGPRQDENQPTAWTVYPASDDADVTAAAISANGGTVIAAPFEVPGNGRMSVALDTAGAPFGV